MERLSEPKHVAAVLEESSGFEADEIKHISDKLKDVKISFGIKHMLEILDFIRQGEREYQVDLLLGAFEQNELGI